MKRFFFILLGLIIILIGLFVSFGIIISSIKERDSGIYWYLISTVGIVIIGCWVLFKFGKNKTDL